ncbi:MAG: hypothetical protein HY788_23985 [Deltaproteobacteria bacterium]|nr:hypothetical protein [Deltaproteobacteria bacterium]
MHSFTFKAPRVIATWFIFFVIISQLSCSSTRENAIIDENVPDHPTHKYPYTEVIGNHHVTFFVDHAEGVIEAWISDAVEKPYLLEESFLEAVITDRNGMHKEIRLLPTDYERRRLYLRKETVRRKPYSNPRIRSKWVAESSTYRYQADFLKSLHQFTMELEVPVEGNRYIARFEFEMPEEENAHHRH